VNYQFQRPRTSPVTAVIAALLALAVAAFEIVLLVREFDVINFATLGEQDPEVLVILGVQAGAGLVLVLGAMFTFARRMAGTVLIVIGSILALAGFFLFPVLAKADLGRYLEAVFQFGGSQQTFQALTLIVTPFALLASVLPPTLNHLRGGQDDHHGPYPGGGGGYRQPEFPDIPGFHQPHMPNLPNIPNVPTNLPRPPRLPGGPQLPNW
jgi:hypothetical protein